MKSKSVKAENGVAPESIVIKKKKKTAKALAIAADPVEPAEKLKTEKSSEIETKTKTAKIKKIKNGNEKNEVIRATEETPIDPVEPAKKLKTEKSSEIETKTKTAKIKKIKNDNEKNKVIPETEETPAEEESKASKRKEYTIFIANLPPTVTKAQLKTLFSKYGTIETVRIRTNDGQKIFFKQDIKNVLALNCYVRFSSKEEMEKACEMNGELVDGNRIRVCPQGKKQIGDVKSTVFVGNIKRGTTENELYDFFGRVGPIEFVRLISQKYFAYVCFKKGVSIKKVLKLDQEKLNDRPLRIQLVDTQRSNVKLNKKGNVVKRRKMPSKSKAKNGAAANAKDSNAAEVNQDFHGNVSEAKNNKKRAKSGVGSAKHKKMLAKKLIAAMNVN